MLNNNLYASKESAARWRSYYWHSIVYNDNVFELPLKKQTKRKKF
jgi:hypothetical protein